MSLFRPYHIEHILLDKSLPVSLPHKDIGHYYVFWWKCIPLGQLFMEPGALVEESELRKKVVESIEPAIAFYSANNKSFVAALHNYFIEKDQERFEKEMARLLSPFTEATVPEQADVSLVICTRNRAAYLKDCLYSLRSLSCLPKEIIVVDNAPSDNSTKAVADLFPEVIYHLEPRPGLDIARNAGLEKATAPIVAFMDDDIRAEPHSIYEIAKTFEQADHAAMTGLVIAAELQSEAQMLFEQEWSFNRGYVDKVYDEAFFNRHLKNGPPVWDIGAGANMAFRKSALTDTGYFDERLDVGAAGCNGDSEMWFRILAKGKTIAYNPRSVVFHQHRKDLKGLHKQLYNYMKGFTVAALIQQQQVNKAGYKRQLYGVLPRWYLYLLAKGFPRYRGRYQTIFSEMRGMLAGLVYYRKHKNKTLVR